MKEKKPNHPSNIHILKNYKNVPEPLHNKFTIKH